MEKLTQSIFDCYNGGINIDSCDVLYDISKMIYDERNLILKTFKALQSEKKLNSHPVDNDIKKMFELSKNNKQPEVSVFYMIMCIKNIITTLMEKHVEKISHSNMILDGKNEIQNIKNDLFYYIFVISEVQHYHIMYAFITFFGLESLFNSHLIVGIDYEYTHKEVALGQYCFDHNVNKSSFLFIFSIPQVNLLYPDIMVSLVDTIMTNVSIRKILHGSDAQDIPYVLEEMLQKDTSKINDFIMSLIDTRYLCEYNKISHGDALNQKCSFYFALTHFQVISEDKKKELEEIDDRMGPKQDIKWNSMDKLASYQILYALYDALFLKYLYYGAINFSMQDPPSGSKEKEEKIYKFILIELTRFIYLDTHGITSMLKIIKEEVDPLNNYFIKKFDPVSKKMTQNNLVDIFKKASVDINLPNCGVKVDHLMEVKYYRTRIIYLVKKITFTILKKRFVIMKDGSTQWQYDPDVDFIVNDLNKLGFTHLAHFVSELIMVMGQKLDSLGFAKR